MNISIHALLAESDGVAQGADTGDKVFLSTLSLRRATDDEMIFEEQIEQISIHALLAESDSEKVELNRTASNFYPRSPCGERL